MSTRTKPPKQRTQIINLLGNPTLTHSRIAEIVGCSTKTVQRTAKEIKPDLEEAEQKLAEYQTLLHEKLPISDRVELVAKIARKADRNPFAVMKALQRVDDLDVILCRRDELKRPQEGSGEHRPSFTLPAGTKVQVNVEVQNSTDAPTINVTPEPAEDEFDA
jgi:hypothetical protein